MEKWQKGVIWIMDEFGNLISWKRYMDVSLENGKEQQDRLWEEIVRKINLKNKKKH